MGIQGDPLLPRRKKEELGMEVIPSGTLYSRPSIFVHTTIPTPDTTRTFFEIPDAVSNAILPPGDERTFVEALVDLLWATHPPE